MSFEDDVESIRRGFDEGDVGQALKRLEQHWLAAKKEKNVRALEELRDVAGAAEEKLSGRDAAKAHRIAYAATQNLRAFSGNSPATGGDDSPKGPDATTIHPPKGQGVGPASSGDGRRTEVRGHNGTVILDDDFVTISRRGFLARASIGKGDKRILLSQITAVQFKPAGPVMNGFIQFTVGGGNESRSRFGSQTRSAVQDENSVIFWWAQRAEFEALRETVERAIAERHRPLPSTAPASSSIPEQIGQLAALRDAGILTDDEFAAKKRDLLARL